MAIPVWGGRVSPVFDVARRLLLVDLRDGLETARAEEPLSATGPAPRARQVAALAPDVLICGAISRALEEMLTAAGVNVVRHTCGPAEDVLRAFVAGRMTSQAFRMPGCGGRRRRRGAGPGGRGGRRRSGGPGGSRWPTPPAPEPPGHD